MIEFFLILLQDEVRSQDTVFVIISVGASKIGRDLAWQFIQDNWSKLFNQYQVYQIILIYTIKTCYHIWGVKPYFIVHCVLLILKLFLVVMGIIELFSYWNNQFNLII